MFDNQQDNNGQTNTDIDAVAKDISDKKPADDNSQPAVGLGTNPSSFSPVMPDEASPAPPPPAQDDQRQSDSDDAQQDNTQQSDQSTETPEPEHETDHQIISNHPSSDDHTSPSDDSPVPSGLEDIKSEALQKLSPLVSKLDQSPEDRYKTLMMLIQASDNQELIKEAYEAANGIEDEALKAEALLGVVNEINYFTKKATQ